MAWSASFPFPPLLPRDTEEGKYVPSKNNVRRLSRLSQLCLYCLNAAWFPRLEVDELEMLIKLEEQIERKVKSRARSSPSLLQVMGRA